jgi:hypothetical protein
MANNLKGNPWTVDTAAVLTTNNVLVKRMVWRPTTTGDDIDVVTNDGSSLWSFKCVAASSNGEIDYNLEVDGVVNGINVVTIDHGTLYIYLK